MFSSNTSQVSQDAVFIEDTFSTFLYTGNGSTQTITNGIDLAGKGGLFWMKNRGRADYHFLVDSARGLTKGLATNSTNAQDTIAGGSLSFQSTGIGLSGNFYIGGASANESGQNYVGWTFRKQPKFFDVVTYTGDGVAGRTVSHNLGSTPGCVIVKRTNTTGNWPVYHRSLSANNILRLNTTNAQIATSTNITAVSSTTFTLGISADVNSSGGTYVAYLFAHDAGGFGLTGTDNVITCGSVVGGTAVNLGYEPQWILMKNAGTAQDWQLVDNMRGMPVSGNDAMLNPNLSAAEGSAAQVLLSATGFTINDSNTQTYIYIAIRRGPMKTPTSGTSVYNAITRTGTGAAATVTGVGFPSDLIVNANRNVASRWKYFVDRLRGAQIYLASNVTDAEYNQSTFPNGMLEFLQDGMRLGADTTGTFNYSGDNNVDYFFRRAPGFFDEVCYTGTGANLAVTHNLGVAPEMIIVKQRNSAGTSWYVSHAGKGSPWATFAGFLNSTAAFDQYYVWYQNPTATQFFVEATGGASASGGTYVAYLFASCPGVSKVGSYTGTGATQTISCGFAARFVLIKRTDSTGDWFVWDTARGMVAGTDPRLALNSTAAEANANWVYTDASGFQIVTTDATVNASGGSYIFLAIS